MLCKIIFVIIEKNSVAQVKWGRCKLCGFMVLISNLFLTFLCDKNIDIFKIGQLGESSFKFLVKINFNFIIKILDAFFDKVIRIKIL